MTREIGSVDDAVDVLIEQMQQSEIYKEYVAQKHRVETDSECVEKIRRYRNLSQEIQNMSDEERVNSGFRIENELDEICSDGRVLDYVQAEVDFARMFQRAQQKVNDAIEMID